MDEKANDPLELQEDARTVFADSLRLLRRTHAAARAQLARAEIDETASLDDLLKSQKLIMAAHDDALKLEQRYNEWMRNRDGNEGRRDGDIDIDAARYEIGCRLDRLRACCRSE